MHTVTQNYTDNRGMGGGRLLPLCPRHKEQKLVCMNCEQLYCPQEVSEYAAELESCGDARCSLIAAAKLRQERDAMRAALLTAKIPFASVNVGPHSTLPEIINHVLGAVERGIHALSHPKRPEADAPWLVYREKAERLAYDALCMVRGTLQRFARTPAAPGERQPEPKAIPVPASAVCVCGHPKGEHPVEGGRCLRELADRGWNSEPVCQCAGFRAAAAVEVRR